MASITPTWRATTPLTSPPVLMATSYRSTTARSRRRITTEVQARVTTLSPHSRHLELGSDLERHLQDADSLRGHPMKMMWTSRWKDRLRERPLSNSRFTMEPLGQEGNSPRRFIHGPGINNTDIPMRALARLIPVVTRVTDTEVNRIILSKNARAGACGTPLRAAILPPSLLQAIPNRRRTKLS